VSRLGTSGNRRTISLLILCVRRRTQIFRGKSSAASSGVEARRAPRELRIVLPRPRGETRSVMFIRRRGRSGTKAAALVVKRPRKTCWNSVIKDSVGGEPPHPGNRDSNSNASNQDGSPFQKRPKTPERPLDGGARLSARRRHGADSQVPTAGVSLDVRVRKFTDEPEHPKPTGRPRQPRARLVKILAPFGGCGCRMRSDPLWPRSPSDSATKTSSRKHNL
jgi:hypothetical protein